MGVTKNVGFDKFPSQGNLLHKRVEVIFGYDSTKVIGGIIIRDDRDEPFETLIMLDDNRVVKATECQYSLVKPHVEATTRVLFNSENRDFVIKWTNGAIFSLKLPDGTAIEATGKYWIEKRIDGSFALFPSRRMHIKDIMETDLTQKLPNGNYIPIAEFNSLLLKMGLYEHRCRPLMRDTSLIESTIIELKEAIDGLKSDYKLMAFYDDMDIKVKLALEQLKELSFTVKEEKLDAETKTT